MRGQVALVPEPLYPDVPSAAEILALPKLDTSVWVGVFGSKALPTTAAQRLSTELSRLLQTNDIRKAFADQGWVAVGGGAAALSKRMAADSATWGGIVRMTGASVD